MVAFVFPGQGSQFKSMGVALLDRYSEFVSVNDEILGCSIKEMCLRNPEKKLNQTLFVIPGPQVDIDRAKKIFEQIGAKLYLILNVSGAFHSFKERAKGKRGILLEGKQF